MKKFPETVSELRDSSVLTVCYDDQRVAAFLAEARRLGALDALLTAVPRADACWYLAGALPREARVEWAQAAARRAKAYADAYASASADAYAAAAHANAYAAASDAHADAYAVVSASAASAAARAASAAASASAAARAAASADAYAAYAAAADAERGIAIRHACALLGWS